VLAAAHRPLLPRQTVPNHDIEVAAKNQIRARAERLQLIEDLVHGPDVAAVAYRTVYAEYADRTAIRPRRVHDLTAHYPAIMPG